MSASDGDSHTEPLDVGDELPDVEALLCDGETFRPRGLHDVLGERGGVFALYGFAFSAIELNWWKRYDRYGWDDWEGVSVVGAGRDGPYAANEFVRQIDSPFRLFADVDGEVARGFGVLRERRGFPDASTARRSVYVVDSDGTVTYRWIAEDDISPQDVDGITSAVEEL